MADLFNRGPLPQDDGRLSERWGQDGSNIINAEGLVTSTATPVVLQTITAGKTGFIKAVVVTSLEAAGTVASVTVKDDSTTIMTISTDITYGSWNVPLPAPLLFDTNVTIVAVSNNDTRVNISGWEE